MLRRFYVHLVMGIVLGLSSFGGGATTQTNSADQTQVEARLRQFDELVHALDAKAIAGLFDPDGEIQHEHQTPTRGREGIESLYSSFSGYQILENDTTPIGTLVYGNLAVQVGSYHQKVKTPAGALVEVSGSFQADWMRSGSKDWLIKRMATTSP